jgi:hypothetical protein
MVKSPLVAASQATLSVKSRAVAPAGTAMDARTIKAIIGTRGVPKRSIQIHLSEKKHSQIMGIKKNSQKNPGFISKILAILIKGILLRTVWG